MKISSLNLKYLSRAHTILGLFTVFLFYIATYFGSITLFLPYIKVWENPSLHYVKENKNINIDLIFSNILKDDKLSKNIKIIFPSFRDKRLQVHDEKSKTIYINTNTNEIIKDNTNHSFISEFFNEIHIGANIPIIGRSLMGLSSIIMIFLCISGFILFIFSKKKKIQSLYYKYHKYLSLLLLPYILIFTLTGAFLGFMLSNSSSLVYAASKTQTANLRKFVAPILFPKDKNIKNSLFEKSMNISLLMKKAQNLCPDLKIQEIKIFSWNQKNSRIRFIGYDKTSRYLSGRINRMYIELYSNNASLYKKKDINNSNISNKILSSFYFLHFIPDEKIILRVFYFIFGIIMSISLVLGFIIYAEKKAKENRKNKHYYSTLNRIALACMLGLIPASSFVFFLYWLLPFDLYEKDIWIEGLFYSFWSFTLFYCFIESNKVKIINDFLRISSIFLLAAVVLHSTKTSFYPWISYDIGLYEVFFVDIILIVFSFIFFEFSNFSKYNSYKGEKIVK